MKTREEEEEEEEMLTIRENRKKIAVRRHKNMI
jgi:hypothetical protein